MADETVKTEVKEAEVFLDEVDFQEVLDIEKNLRATEDRLNKLAGTRFRLERDQEALYELEKSLNLQMDTKRKELVKRYRLDGNVKWQVDPQTRRVVYFK